MDNAELYLKCNELQRRDVQYVLKKYLLHMNWCSTGKGQILDVGCGPGDVTADVLIPAFPHYYGQVIGVDLSENMVKFANERYGNRKLSFHQWDITNKVSPLMLHDYFDHVFSFYCFNWIRNQRQGFTNIYNLLKAGGDILFIVLGNHPIFEIYRKMASTTKWYPYMKEVEYYVAFYQDSEDAASEIEKLLEDIGFIVHICVTKKRKFTHSNFKEYRDFVESVNPFISKIPSNLRNEYLDDHIAKVKKMNLIESNNKRSGKENFVEQYSIVIIHASKYNF